MQKPKSREQRKLSDLFFKTGVSTFRERKFEDGAVSLLSTLQNELTD